MSIQSKVDYHAQSLADKALAANDPKLVQSILGDLSKSVQSGDVKPYVGIPLIQTISQHLQGLSQQATMRQALQPAPQVPPQGTLGAGVLQQANAETAPQQAQPGIAAAPSGLPTQYAQGGIVAFNEGGDVEHYDVGGATSLVPMSYEQYSHLIPAMQQAYVKQYGAPPQGSITKGIPGLSNKPSMSPELQRAISGIPQLQTQTAPAAPEQGTPYKPSFAETMQANRNPLLDAINAQQTQAQAQAQPKPSKAKPAADTTAPTPTPAQTTAPADTDEYGIKALMSKAQSERDDLKQLILGDEAERDKARKIDLWTNLLGAGFKMMGGTSPYAMANIGPAGEQAAQGIAQIQARDEAAKQNRITQLVNLGLKGSELDIALAHAGIDAQTAKNNKAYQDAQVAHTLRMEPTEISLQRAQAGLAGAEAGITPLKGELLQAQAKYYANRPTTGTMGTGAVTKSSVDLLNQANADFADPKSASIVNLMPPALQKGLKNGDPAAIKPAQDFVNRYYLNMFGLGDIPGITIKNVNARTLAARYPAGVNTVE